MELTEFRKCFNKSLEGELIKIEWIRTYAPDYAYDNVEGMYLVKLAQEKTLTLINSKGKIAYFPMYNLDKVKITVLRGVLFER